jgi:hypothetical protein
VGVWLGCVGCPWASLAARKAPQAVQKSRLHAKLLRSRIKREDCSVDLRSMPTVTVLCVLVLQCLKGEGVNLELIRRAGPYSDFI